MSGNVQLLTVEQVAGLSALPVNDLPLAVMEVKHVKLGTTVRIRRQDPTDLFCSEFNRR
jgi:hypothetical protein